MRPTPLMAALGSCLLTFSAFAATVPDAGQVMQNLEQQPRRQDPQPSVPINLPDTPNDQPADDSPKIMVNHLRLEGNQAIPSDSLLALLADMPGKEWRVSELQAAANRITRYYREQGYPLARAYLPVQEIEGGIITITVLEGRYGDVKVSDNAALGGSALAPLTDLRSGDVVQAHSLERSLLLLQDTPGVDVKSTLRPGASTGTSDLLVDVQQARRVSGSVDLDNYGNRFVGQFRAGGTVNLNNPMNLGDRLTLRATASEEDQRYGRLAYQVPVGPWATQLGVAYSDMSYKLGKDFKDLRAHGSATIASIYALQPLIRSRNLNVSTQVQFDEKRLMDNVDLFGERRSKRAQTITATLFGNHRDNWLGSAQNSFSLAWTHGQLSLDGLPAQRLDAATANTQGGFDKVNPTFARSQYLGERFNLFAQLQGQWANGNLDSSEKLCLGGAYGVRAYPQGETCGDQGLLANVELRYALTEAWQVSTFVDHGDVRLNKRPWTQDNNHRRLSGAGIGVTWATTDWQVNAVTAWKIGNEKPQSDVERSPQMWVQVVRYF
jgi:hemolysin activation/secretion protein